MSSKVPTFIDSNLKFSLIYQANSYTIESLKKAMRRRGFKLDYKIGHSNILINRKGRMKLETVPSAQVTLRDKCAENT